MLCLHWLTSASNHPLSSYSPTTTPKSEYLLPLTQLRRLGFLRWRLMAMAITLVVVPVFFQAPLVRSLPWLSLSLTGAWLMAGLSLMARPATYLWGDLLVGFSWTWLAGSIYWGWFRWEPLVHLPIEAIGLPVVGICLALGWGSIGSYFYLGSLLGTAITDLYLYWNDLIPYWRQLMAVDQSFVPAVLQEAVAHLCTGPALLSAIELIFCLLLLTVGPLLYSRRLHWWTFSGAVLSTLLVDGLFFLTALAA
ncbi:hypothetical protein XM38_051800 [Halomicronema hongdechloris C2206]|uniref:DUF3120 domain-containing protein n=1 Tax=Halomicronema hongdechloris C2206 TaxID=1641165 RepID=A0A1Z3HVA5_9CYAN|nr:hypothetical protein XM38_051800 [Halomicronema hongdechloris C2206]